MRSTAAYLANLDLIKINPQGSQGLAQKSFVYRRRQTFNAPRWPDLRPPHAKAMAEIFFLPLYTPSSSRRGIWPLGRPPSPSPMTEKEALLHCSETVVNGSDRTRGPFDRDAFFGGHRCHDSICSRTFWGVEKKEKRNKLNVRSWWTASAIRRSTPVSGALMTATKPTSGVLKLALRIVGAKVLRMGARQLIPSSILLLL